MTASADPEPVKLVPNVSTGILTGANRRYEKRLSDMAGVYRDTEAYERLLVQDEGAPVYWVEDLWLEGSAELITGLSVLEPGSVGTEFFMTRGHLHSRPDRAEVYLAISGSGVMVLEHPDGRNAVIPIAKGEAVQVPGYWLHRSVNVGTERFTTIFSYAADAGQDYEIISEAGGMRQLVVPDGDGWTVRDNPNHSGYRRV